METGRGLGTVVSFEVRPPPSPVEALAGRPDISEEVNRFFIFSTLETCRG